MLASPKSSAIGAMSDRLNRRSNIGLPEVDVDVHVDLRNSSTCCCGNSRARKNPSGQLTGTDQLAYENTAQTTRALLVGPRRTRSRQRTAEIRSWRCEDNTPQCKKTSNGMKSQSGFENVRQPFSRLTSNPPHPAVTVGNFNQKARSRGCRSGAKAASLQPYAATRPWTIRDEAGFDRCLLLGNGPPGTRV